VATAARLCGSDSAAITIREGEVYRYVSNYAFDNEFWAIHRQRTIVPGRQSVAGRVALEGRVVHVADILADPDYALPEIVAAGVRTILGVPLLREGAVLGTITMARSRVEPFTERQIDLVRTFADQAVIAIENTRLLTETREALEQQTATAEVLQIINSSPGDLAPVFEAILEKAHKLCSADIGALVSFDGEHLQALAIRGMPAAFDDFVREPFLPDSNSFEERLIRDQRLIHIPDVQALGPLPENPITRAAIRLGGIRTVLFVPLQKDADAAGYIAAARAQVRPFADKEIALLQNFAAQAVIAMENARLLDELHQRTDQVAELNRGLEARVAEQVEELGRVGRLKRFLAPSLPS